MGSAQRAGQASKQVRILENRLDKANKRYNEALNENKAIRGQIDDLRRERVVYEELYAKLEKHMSVRKQDVAKLVDQIADLNGDKDELMRQIQKIQAEYKDTSALSNKENNSDQNTTPNEEGQESLQIEDIQAEDSSISQVKKA